MSSSDKKKIPILLGLLALLFLSAFFNFSRSPNPAPVPVNQRRLSPDFLQAREPLPSLDLLNKNPRESGEVQRNLFQFGEEGHIQQDDADEQEEAEETQPAVQSAPALPDVRYLGFYQEKSHSNVRLGAISNGGRIFVGGVGEVLASKYQILQIQQDSIVLRILPENKIMRFALGKNTPPVEIKSWNTTQVPAVSNLQEQQ
jgi:hypothetical protein